MRHMIARYGVVGAVSIVFSAMLVGVASAQTTSAVTNAAETLKDDLVSIGTTVLPFAAAVLAITFGWRFAKKFVRG